jgi:regulator of RNase E activity RraB
MSEDEDPQAWEVYRTQLDEDCHPAAILVDVSIREPDPKRPHLVRVVVHLQEPDYESGFPHKEESQTLYALEDELTPSLERAAARLVGRVTTQGVRDFVYYAPGPISEDRVRDALSQWPRYHFDLTQEDDAEWNFYNQILVPSPREWQSIMNGKVIHNLSEHGDDLETPREVDHHLTFPSEGALESFLEELQGYACVSREADEGGPGFSLHLTRTHAVDFSTVDAIVFELAERASAVAGSYDGWGCGVVTDEG